jgi:hypothetical protein
MLINPLRRYLVFDRLAVDYVEDMLDKNCLAITCSEQGTICRRNEVFDSFL